MNMLKHFHGSILLEALISIIILGLIVIGSFYSYSFVYQRIRSQRDQREALGRIQGWMELTRLYVSDPNNSSNLNNSANTNIAAILLQHFAPDIDTNIFDPSEVDIRVDTNNSMVIIRSSINLDGLPLPLYTEIYLEGSR
ncbi:MAG: hypothetical protein ACMUIU_12025 [bacterium]